MRWPHWGGDSHTWKFERDIVHADIWVFWCFLESEGAKQMGFLPDSQILLDCTMVDQSGWIWESHSLRFFTVITGHGRLPTACKASCFSAILSFTEQWVLKLRWSVGVATCCNKVAQTWIGTLMFNYIINMHEYMFKHIILLQTEIFTNQPSKQTPGCPRLGLLVNVCIRCFGLVISSSPFRPSLRSHSITTRLFLWGTEVLFEVVIGPCGSML